MYTLSVLLFPLLCRPAPPLTRPPSRHHTAILHPPLLLVLVGRLTFRLFLYCHPPFVSRRMEKIADLWGLSGSAVNDCDSRDIKAPTLLTSRNLTEHVLRSSSGDSNRTTTRPRRSSSAITNPYSGFEPPPNDTSFLRGTRAINRPGKNSRFSPTPSVRRGKVAALLREHASPPGVRVTAGGRLVPDGTSPLTSPRAENPGKYDNYPQVPHLAPGVIPSHYTLTHLEGMVVSIGGNRICQVVNGQLVHVGFTNSSLSLQIPATNPFVPSTASATSTAFPAPGALPLTSPFTGVIGSNVGGGPQDPKLKEAYEKKASELKVAQSALDRDEVIHHQKGLMTPALKAHIVERRKSLINQYSQIREILKSMEDPNTQASGGFHHCNTDHAQANVWGFYALPSEALTHNAPAQPYFPQTFHDHYADHMSMAGNTGVPLHSLCPAYATHASDLTDTWYGGTKHGQATSAFASTLENSRTSAELTERTGNVKFNTPTFSRPYDPNVCAKGNENVSMNLDGSGVQPRRSHAVEIKKPLDVSQACKSKLNPTSPSYDPSQMLSQDAVNRDTNEAIEQTTPPEGKSETEKNVYSPKRLSKTDPGPSGRLGTETSLDEGNNYVGQSFQTSSTMNTAGTANTPDFFPQDTGSHSGRHYEYLLAQESSANLSGWMPQENDPSVMNLHVTPSRSANKFRFKDSDSPDDSSFKDAANASAKSSLQRPIPRSDVIAKPPALRLSSSNWCGPGEDNSGAVTSGSATTSFDSNSHCENLLSQRQPTALQQGHIKTDAYWAGFRQGIKQELCEIREDEDYRRGYRDGLLRSNEQPLTGTSPLSSCRLELKAKQSFDKDFKDFPAPSRCSSFPTFQAPRVPSNTAANSPLRQSIENEDPNVQAAVSFDSALNACPSNQPHSASSAQRGAGTQTSHTRLRSLEPTSPLAERSLRSALRQPNSASKAESSTCRILSASTYEQQRYPRKVQTSVAPSKSQARGWIPHQYDGSAEDESKGLLKETQPATTTSSPRSPVAKDKGSAPSSPIKRASSAVHKLTQIGVMSKRGTSVELEDVTESQLSSAKVKKESDPAKMTTPEKAKWRNKWRKRFDELKKDEQKEIDDYRRAHPMT